MHENNYHYANIMIMTVEKMEIIDKSVTWQKDFSEPFLRYLHFLPPAMHGE